MLDIDLFYAVCEFADGRGQIHIHFLGWIKDGQPHELMHRKAPAGILAGGTAAEAAWREAIQKAADNPMHPAPLQYADVPASVTTEGDSQPERDARGWAWKGFVLERWLRERNFSAKHPAGSSSISWPAPEGSAPSIDKSNGKAPCSQALSDEVRFNLLGLNQKIDHVVHRSETVSMVKRHSCVPGYCLRPLRGKDSNRRECAKGGFGLEAPLLKHMLSGPMWPFGEDETEDSVESSRKEVEEKRGPPAQHRGRAIRFDVKKQYYTVRVDNEREVALEGTNGKLYICSLADPREHGDAHASVRPALAADGEVRVPCTAVNCAGCDGAPPMGKKPRPEPELIIDGGIVKIELPREHPRVVQGVQVVTEWWRANDDQSIICCSNGPAECSIEELAEVARYVPGYMTKGNKSSEAFAAIFKAMLRDTDEDTPVRKLVRSLLIKICISTSPSVRMAKSCVRTS